MVGIGTKKNGQWNSPSVAQRTQKLKKKSVHLLAPQFYWETERQLYFPTNPRRGQPRSRHLSQRAPNSEHARWSRVGRLGARGEMDPTLHSKVLRDNRFYPSERKSPSWSGMFRWTIVQEAPIKGTRFNIARLCPDLFALLSFCIPSGSN